MKIPPLPLDDIELGKPKQRNSLHKMLFNGKRLAVPSSKACGQQRIRRGRYNINIVGELSGAIPFF